MKRFLFYLIVFVLAILSGIVISLDPGYVLLAWHHWTAEMPLWFAIIVLIIGFVLLSFGFGVIRTMKSTYLRWIAWKQKRKGIDSRTLTEKSFIALIQGEWKRMEKTLIRAAKIGQMPFLHYLGAAFAAQQQGSDKRRAQYIRNAYAVAPHERVTIGLLQAKLQLDRGQFELARATLKHLQQIAPSHTRIFQLLCELYIKLHDWNALAELFPVLRKHMDKKAFQALQIKVYRHLLSESYAEEKALQKFWKNIPRTLREMPILLKAYCEALLVFHRDEKVARLIEKALGHQWDDDLIVLYGNLQFVNPAEHLVVAEHWLRKRKYNGTLLLTLAKVSVQLKYWAKAREYCLASLQIEKTPLAYAWLGYVYAKSGETEKALQAYEHTGRL